MLQGLLDTDGGPVTQRGRTLPRPVHDLLAALRDDVVFLVRSLGGVAYWRRRRRRAASRAARTAAPSITAHDAYVLDIRLPAGIEPFRLARKRERYARARRRAADALHRSRSSPTGEAETVCIQVAAADSLYVTDDFLVTHNTLNDSLRDPRRGAEHHARADEDVPDAARVQLEDGRHRRHHADRPAARSEVRTRRRRATSSRTSRASSSSASAARTSSATGWCSASSRPTTSTPARQAPELRPAGRAPARLRSRSRSRSRRRTPRTRARSSGCVRARAGVGRRARRARRDRVRRRRRGSRELNAEHRGKDEPTDVLSLPHRRRRALGAGAARARRHRDLPASTRPTCARRSSTARCTSTGMDHETDDGEMLALQRELARGAE